MVGLDGDTLLSAGSLLWWQHVRDQAGVLRDNKQLSAKTMPERGTAHRHKFQKSGETKVRRLSALRSREGTVVRDKEEGSSGPGVVCPKWDHVLHSV